MICGPSFGWFTDFCTVSLSLSPGRPRWVVREGSMHVSFHRKPGKSIYRLFQMPWTILRIFLLLNLWISRVALTFLALGFIWRSSQQGHGRPRSCGAVPALPRQHHLSFPLFALEHSFLQRGSQRQRGVLVSGSERRGGGLLLAVYPKLHGAGSSIPPQFLLHLQKYVCIDVCGMNLLDSSVSLICYVLLGCFFCRLARKLYVLFTTNTEVFDVICCCVTFNNCKIKM